MIPPRDEQEEKAFRAYVAAQRHGVVPEYAEALADHEAELRAGIEAIGVQGFSEDGRVALSQAAKRALWTGGTLLLMALAAWAVRLG